MRGHQQCRGHGRQQHGADAAEEGEQSHGDAAEGTGGDGDGNVPKLSPARWRSPGTTRRGGHQTGTPPGAGDREECRCRDGDG